MALGRRWEGVGGGGRWRGGVGGGKGWGWESDL